MPRTPAWAHDVAGIALLLLFATVFLWDLVVGGVAASMDTAAAFYPWYAFLGATLRSGAIPVWNPHQFSGAPFAADPESGWMYLPAMLLFSVFSLQLAAASYLMAHALLAGLSTYWLARTFGFSVAGSVLAGVAYAGSGFFLGHNVCCFAYASVAAWLPAAIVGVERATRSASWPIRATWWGVAGLGLSQILATWIGQGAYYATLVVGSFLVFRTCLAPHLPTSTLGSRLKDVTLHGVGVAAFGFLLAAGGLLPRLEYNALSNLPGGYPPPELDVVKPTIADWTLVSDWFPVLLTPGFHYMGISVAVLAVAALVLAPRRSEVVFFAVLSVVLLVLARDVQTPLHATFSVLPGFERIHDRSPGRLLMVFFLGPALLAGASVTTLQTAIGTARPRWAWLTAALIVAVVVGDLYRGSRLQFAEAATVEGPYRTTRLDLERYYAPTPAARFLQSAGDPSGFRYVGYAEHVFGGPMPYTLGWSNPRSIALEVNNRALLSGLHDVQGYNPIHVARYDEFVAAMNGHRQDYHHADLFADAFSSPLLDLLGARYIVMPAEPASDEAQVTFARDLERVFVDDSVQIFENPHAFPRVWMVHSTHQVQPGDALGWLRSEVVDPRLTALIEQPPPPLGAVDVEDSVEMLDYGADRIQVRTRTAAPGLLVLSEVYYPAWRAYVDGQPVALYPTNHALRGVPVPGGEHRVEVRFESVALWLGLGTSTVALLILVGLGASTYCRPR